jgi:hypothetical protein
MIILPLTVMTACPEKAHLDTSISWQEYLDIYSSLDIESLTMPLSANHIIYTADRTFNICPMQIAILKLMLPDDVHVPVE